MLAALIGIAGCGGECQAVCESSVVVTAVVDRPLSELAGTSLVYCRNGACTLPTPFMADSVIESGGLCATMEVAAEEPASTTIHVIVDLRTDHCAPPKLEEGDRYSVTITDANGQTVANEAGIATYRSSNHCGTDCVYLLLELAPL